MRQAFIAPASVCIIAIIVASLWLFTPQARYSGILAEPETVVLPFTWGLPADVAMKRIEQQSTTDPLIFGMDFVSAFHRRAAAPHEIDVATAAFERFMSLRNEAGYWHHDAYASYPAGWYSGMDFSSMALAALVLSEISGNVRYASEGLDLIRQMIRPIKQGGANDTVASGGCWLGEYVWSDMAPEDQNFVLNGALYALQVLEIYRLRFPHIASLDRTSECMMRILRTKALDFEFAGGRWTYYMLSPKAPNQAHYIIYETNQMDALFSITGDQFFYEHAARRRSMFAAAYPVLRRGDQFAFSALGQAHPFVPDIYRPTIEFRDRTGAALLSVDGSLKARIPGRYFISGDMPADANTACVSVSSGEHRIEMFCQPIGEDAPPATSIHPFEVEPKFDARASSGAAIDILPETISDVTLPPDQGVNAQGRVHLVFRGPVPLIEMSAFALSLSTSADIHLAIGIRDAEDNEAFRYLPSLGRSGRFVIPLTAEGFEGYDNLWPEVVQLVLYAYTPPGTKATTMEIDRVTTLSSFFDLQSMPDFEHLLLTP